MSRAARELRKTKETEVEIEIDLDGKGTSAIKTGIGFFDHLLDALQKHAHIDMKINASGDLHIDGHHTVEDVGIVLGLAFDKALGARSGIARFGYAYCPLDEALARAVVDVSGRGLLRFVSKMPAKTVGDFDGELFEEFLRAFAHNAKMTIHVTLLCGKNGHHAYEAMMKALARAIRMAISIDAEERGAPSTKGVI
jgi:imidazoleglycerol-phosphate dehydratase